jgi:hypothetical protein
MPSWLIVSAAVVLAFPFGWGVGVLGALIISGRNFGQLPAVTVPLGIIAAIVFALWPSFKASTRFKVMLAGSVAFVLIGWLFA